MNSPTFLHRFARCAANHRRVRRRDSSDFRPRRRSRRRAAWTAVFCLIFDTSSAMKARVPATQYAVERLFFSMMNGQLQSGDTIGVWTFDRKLRKGEFPLQGWLPQNAAMIASSITNFVRHQRYSKSTRFDVLMPEVNRPRAEFGTTDRADFLRRRWGNQGNAVRRRDQFRFQTKRECVEEGRPDIYRGSAGAVWPIHRLYREFLGDRGEFP